MIKFDVYQTDSIGKASNCYHKNHIEVVDKSTLTKAVSKDFVTAKYKDNYRSSDNFISANALPMDIDNDHTDVEADFITLDDIKDFFKDTCICIQYSRNHMKSKGKKGPRPKFHLIFPLKDEIKDKELYVQIRKDINNIFPFFDTNTLDAARCLFGTDPAEVEIIEGSKDIVEFLKEYNEFLDLGSSSIPEVISEGNRNATMSKIAAKLLVRYGNSEEAKNKFLEASDKCNPRLPQSELKTIWHSALKFYKKVQANPNYKAPEDYKKANQWKSKLLRDEKTGAIIRCGINLSTILNNDLALRNFAYNELAHMVEVTGKLPWDRPAGSRYWREADTAQLKAYLDSNYCSFTMNDLNVYFTKIADDRHFHPIRVYLDNLPKWDGLKRVEDLFIKYLMADDNAYVRSVTKKAFVAAVSRIYNPGQKFDSIIVLDGVQGIGKSTILKDLVTSEYYSDALSLTDMDSKDGAEKLQGFWIIEIGELAGMKKADIEKVKAFITTSDDKYRPSYGRVVESHPRQCIIIATVNGERGYLRDITGNRRFWIIKLHQTEQIHKWVFDDEFRKQFWAEVKFYYEQGEKLYLEGAILADSEKAQKDAMEKDERQGMIEEYLNTPLPDDWDSMDLYARRNYLSGDITSPKGTVKRTSVSNAEIWCECFCKNMSDLKSSDSYQIAAIMAQIDGWERTTTNKRIPIYGRQRLYKKI